MFYMPCRNEEFNEVDTNYFFQNIFTYLNNNAHLKILISVRLIYKYFKYIYNT